MLKGFYQEEKSAKIDKCIIYTVFAMLIIIPIIAYKYESLSISPVVMNNYYSTDLKSNIFNFYKSIILYLGTIISLGLFSYKTFIINKELKENKINIAIAILAIFIILSTILSRYKGISLFGNFDRNEGALAWFSYLTVFFVLYNINIEKKYIKYFYFIIIPFLLINLILSTLNLYGINVLKFDIVQMMLGGNGNIGGTLWTTLYHYNFMSGIGAVMFAVSFVYMILEEDIKKKIILSLGTIISFTIVISSNSIGGFLTVLLIIPIIIPLIWNLREKKQTLIWSLGTLIISSIIYVVLNNKNPMVYAESLAIIEKINGVSAFIIPGLIVLYILFLLILSKINKKKCFNIITIAVSTIIIISSVAYSFIIEKENKMIDKNLDNTNIVRISETPIFTKLNEMSTDRLNIWTKTIDLINDKPIFGHGFDTFPYIFIPNDDNGGLSTYGEVIDKPHNWYLTVAYGGGLVSLVCLLAIILYILKNVVYSSIDKIDNKYLYVFGIGVITYAIQGMFNDSLVGTSIFFWIFAGLCMNLISNQHEKIEE